MDVLGWIFLIIIAILGSYFHVFYFDEDEDYIWTANDLLYSKFWVVNLHKALPHFTWFMFSFFCIFYLFATDYSSNGLNFMNFFVLFVGISTLAFLIGKE